MRPQTEQDLDTIDLSVHIGAVKAFLEMLSVYYSSAGCVEHLSDDLIYLIDEARSHIEAAQRGIAAVDAGTFAPQI